MDELYCLFCQHKNKRNTILCEQCGARLIPQDKKITAELASQQQAIVAGLPDKEQWLPGLPAGSFVLFVAGLKEPIVLTDVSTCILGRDESHTGEFVLDLSRFGKLAQSISRRHAMISVTPGGFVLNDLGSANGTRLNQELLQPGKAYPLQNNDQIKLGLFTLIICFQAQETPRQSVKLLLRERNTLVTLDHLFGPTFMLTQLAPYLYAINELQEIIAACREQPVHEICIHTIEARGAEVTVHLELDRGILDTIYRQILPWRNKYTEFMGRESDYPDVVLEEATRHLTALILTQSAPTRIIPERLMVKFQKALCVLATSRLEPFITG